MNTGDQRSRIRERPIGGRVPDKRELGPAARVDGAAVLRALRLVGRGEIYDLDTGRWPGMPVYPGGPQFQVIAHRTPSGTRAQGDLAEWTGTELRFAGIDDLIIGCTHSGTHIDSLAHITIGEDDHWYSGHSAHEFLSDFGPLRADAAALPPLITRGVLIDVASHLTLDPLPAGYKITVDDLRGALAEQRSEVRVGDCVIVRTGYMRVWGTDAAAAHYGAGLGLEAGRWLADQGAVAVGGDTESMEAIPSGDLVNPHPLHVEFLVHRGVHIIELLYLEALAHDRAYEFLFIGLPPKIKGATGAFLRAVAVV